MEITGDLAKLSYFPRSSLPLLSLPSRFQSLLTSFPSFPNILFLSIPIANSFPSLPSPLITVMEYGGAL